MGDEFAGTTMAAGDKRNAPPAPASRPDGPDNQGRPSRRDVFWLKVLVYGMAAVMAVMMLVIIGRVVYLVNKPKPSSDQAPGEIAVTAPAAPAASRIALPAGATIVTMAISETRLAVHYIVDGRREIAIFDAATARLVSRLVVEAGSETR